MAKGYVRRSGRVVLYAVALATTIAAASLPARQHEHQLQCRPAGPLVQLRELPEASGIAVSRRNPGRIWTHNDSGEPILFALNDRGAVTGRVRLTGVVFEDWEAVAVGMCPGGSCLYVGDIGDNDGKRRSVAVYRVPEPGNVNGDVAVQEVFHASYPDGPHDAEALLVTPKGEILIVTKGVDGPIAVYRFPHDVRPGTTVKLERVGAPLNAGKFADDDRITDGALSPDGMRVVLRSKSALHFYDGAELTAGKWRESGRVDVKSLKEPQGEGVAFGDDRTLYLAGEGSAAHGGTLIRLTCAF